MKLANRRVRGAIAVLSALVLPATAGGAATTTEITSLTATATAAAVQVQGKAVFAADPVTVGEDPSGDAVQPGVGADITGASIEMVGGRNLIFTFAIGDQPPAPASAAPTINYNWGLVVDGSDSGLFLSAGRAGLDGINPSTEPIFNLSQNSEDGFLHVATLEGKMADGVVQWTVPLSLIGAKPGSVVSSTGDVRPGSHGGVPGVVTFYNNTGGDTISVSDYTVPGTVMLGIAPAGTPVEEIAATHQAAPRNTGTFSELLPRPADPGTYTVLAIACVADDVCATRTASVSL